MSGPQRKVERIADDNLAEPANTTGARADLYGQRELRFRITAPADRARAHGPSSG